jgi:hypothetical protein
MGGAGSKIILGAILIIPVLLVLTFISGTFGGSDGDDFMVYGAADPYKDPCPDIEVRSVTVVGVEEGMVDYGSTYHIIIEVVNSGNATMPGGWEIEVKEFMDIVYQQVVMTPLEVNATLEFGFEVKVDNTGDWGLDVELKKPLYIVEKDTSNNRSEVHYSVKEREEEGGFLFQFICCSFWLIIVGFPLATVIIAFIILKRKSRDKDDMVSYVKMIWDPTQGP